MSILAPRLRLLASLSADIHTRWCPGPPRSGCAVSTKSITIPRTQRRTPVFAILKKSGGVKKVSTQEGSMQTPRKYTFHLCIRLERASSEPIALFCCGFRSANLSLEALVQASSIDIDGFTLSHLMKFLRRSIISYVASVPWSLTPSSSTIFHMFNTRQNQSLTRKRE